MDKYVFKIQRKLPATTIGQAFVNRCILFVRSKNVTNCYANSIVTHSLKQLRQLIFCHKELLTYFTPSFKGAQIRVTQFVIISCAHIFVMRAQLMVMDCWWKKIWTGMEEILYWTRMKKKSRLMNTWERWDPTQIWKEEWKDRTELEVWGVSAWTGGHE